MVFEAGENASIRSIRESRFDRHVADQPRPVTANRFDIQQADALDLLVAELVPVAE